MSEAEETAAAAADNSTGDSPAGEATSPENQTQDQPKPAPAKKSKGKSKKVTKMPAKRKAAAKPKSKGGNGTRGRKPIDDSVTLTLNDKSKHRFNEGSKRAKAMACLRSGMTVAKYKAACAKAGLKTPDAMAVLTKLISLDHIKAKA
jgi:hypothetical protein